MVFQPVPAAAAVSVRWLLPNGVLAENTFYAQYNDNPDASQLEELCVNIYEAAEEAFLAQLSNLCALREVYARGLSEVEDAQWTYAPTVPPLGLITGEALPNNVSFAIARRSGSTGRSTRGRIFWPLIARAQVTGANFVIGTSQQLMVGACMAIDGATVLSGAIPSIVSRFTNGTQRPVGVTYPIQSWVATDPRLDTRRLRMPAGS